MTDERLTDRWEACALERSISHEEHVCIARVLIRRHGREEAIRRLLRGTRANCDVMKGPERFDEELTERWGLRIADAVEAADDDTFEGFACLHPELLQSDLLGLPAWRTRRDRS